MALVAVVFMTILIGLLVVAIATDQLAQSKGSVRQGQRISSTDASEGGAQVLQQALLAGRDTQRDGFTITVADLEAAADLVDGDTVSNATTAYPTVDTGGLGVTVVEPVDSTGYRSSWQVVRMMQPTAEHPYLTVYIRGWRQRGTDNKLASQGAISKVRMRPGSMADYQIISDGPIQLDPGIVVNGRMHANGWIDETVTPPAANGNLRVWSQGAASCQSSAGIQPIVSTAQGEIDLGGAAGCVQREYTDRFIPLNLANKSVERMRANCGGQVTCSNYNPSVPGDAFARVTLNGGTLSVTPPAGGGGGFSLSTGANQARALLFNRPVRVSGTTSGRVTIATWSTQQPGIEAPDIIIEGNVGRSAPDANNAHALGLIAENDIVIDHAAGCPSSITAAMIAVTGGVALPWESRTPTPFPSPAQCGTVNVLGSIASHAHPTLRWSWGSSWTGYQSRSYQWDPWLAAIQPPFWPATNPWEVLELKAANADCLFGGAKAGSNECR